MDTKMENSRHPRSKWSSDWAPVSSGDWSYLGAGDWQVEAWGAGTSVGAEGWWGEEQGQGRTETTHARCGHPPGWTPAFLR
jgi:hypothetical protein